nr:DUF397 domain-containing protein [uncultured Actinoplanes sp.]
MAGNPDNLTGWKKSSRSAQGNCVEVNLDGEDVLIRDTKDRQGPVIAVSKDAWQAFLDGIIDGEFDRP